MSNRIMELAKELTLSQHPSFWDSLQAEVTRVEAELATAKVLLNVDALAFDGMRKELDKLRARLAALEGQEPQISAAHAVAKAVYLKIAGDYRRVEDESFSGADVAAWCEMEAMDIDPAIAQPGQPAATGEPVAWRRWDADGGRIVTQSKRVAEIWADQSAAAEPLFTHPAPMVPMTDENLDQLVFDCGLSATARDIARAIEAHHSGAKHD